MLTGLHGCLGFDSPAGKPAMAMSCRPCRATFAMPCCECRWNYRLF